MSNTGTDLWEANGDQRMEAAFSDSDYTVSNKSDLATLAVQASRPL